MRKFPCPYCKGEYSWVEPVLDDGSGPTYTCGFCDEGMIEIGSEKHMQIKANNPPKWFLWEQIAELRYAVSQVIDALENRPEFDVGSDRDYLLRICRDAHAFQYKPNMVDSK